MFSQSAYTAWLDQRAGQIFEKVTHQEPITNEETLVLILKAQNDTLREVQESVNQLRRDMERRFEQVDHRFEQVERRFEQVERQIERLSANFKWGIIAAMAYVSLLVAVLKFVP